MPAERIFQRMAHGVYVVRSASPKGARRPKLALQRVALTIPGSHASAARAVTRGRIQPRPSRLTRIADRLERASEQRRAGDAPLLRRTSAAARIELGSEKGLTR